LGNPLFAQHRDGRWLEVGANSGDLVAALRRHSVDISGCDVDTVAVEVGQRAGLPLTVADLTEHPPDGEYDVILVVHTLEHIPDAAALLRNLAASLVPGGLLHICVPNYGGLLPRLMRDDWGFLVPLQHVWHFTPRTLGSLLSGIPRLEQLDIRCVHSLEPTGEPGLKGTIKSVLRVLGERIGRSDEIRATFQAA
jgi:2-polyprenyl-3-methyl-5-hydroxy-6-metoxy-1,4-benzoquinol methylase